MKEENVIESQNQVEETTQTNEPNYKALYEQAQQKIDAIAKKKDELLNETKAAKREREEAAKKAYEESQKNGEYEKLWKTEAQEKETLKQQLEQFQKEYKQEKINSHSMRLAAELAKEDGGLSAKILAKLLAENVSAFTDDRGTLTNDDYETVKKSVLTNKDFAPLLAGNKASGGGAPGNRSSAATKTEMTRADFSKLTPQGQYDFSMKVKAGNASLID